MCPRARDDKQGVEHDVHDMQLTGAMVAQTCGMHQGAEVTLAWFEASRDLQSANKERDEEDKVRQWWGSRGEVSDGGGARTKASWWHCYHVQQSHLTQGQSALEDSCCGSWNWIPSSMLRLPLHQIFKTCDILVDWLFALNVNVFKHSLSILDIGCICECIIKVCLELCAEHSAFICDGPSTCNTGQGTDLLHLVFDSVLNCSASSYIGQGQHYAIVWKFYDRVLIIQVLT